MALLDLALLDLALLDLVLFGLALLGFNWFGFAWFGFAWFGFAWFGFARFGFVWFGCTWFYLVWLKNAMWIREGSNIRQAQTRSDSPDTRWKRTAASCHSVAAAIIGRRTLPSALSGRGNVRPKLLS